MNIKIIAISLLAAVLTGCAKERKTFTLKTIRLNDYRHTTVPAQQLRLEVADGNSTKPLAYTELYPGDLPLPATFNIYPTLPMTLYSKTYEVRLWGTATGYIGSCRIDMDAYKIIFPIDMEVKNDSLSISIMGSWH